jgi:hypothetical protein
MKTARGTCRDIVACFVWKKVRPGFPSLIQNWRRRDGGWDMCDHREGHVRIKSKTDGSIRRATSESTIFTLSSFMYLSYMHFSFLVFYLDL